MTDSACVNAASCRRRAGLSKLNSMRHVVDWELAPVQRAFPDSVDVSSPDALLAPTNSKFGQSTRLGRQLLPDGLWVSHNGTSLERR